jgi:HK97 family phage portal protein
MKLFGKEITKGRSNSKLLRRILYPNQYGRELATPMDFESLVKAYRSWIYVCSSKNSTSVASVPLKLYVAKTSRKSLRGYPTKKIMKQHDIFLREDPSLNDLQCVKKAVEIEEILEHPALELLRNVNNFYNRFTLFELTQLHQELAGNSYWYIVDDKFGIPKEIWPIFPQDLKIIPSKTKFIKGYKHLKGTSEQFFSEREIIHFKMPSPNNYYYGHSPLMAVTDAYNIGQNMNTYENALFSNMGRLEGAFETEDELSEFEFERLRKQIDTMFGGVSNVGKSPLLEKGVKYKNYGLAPKELSYLQGRKSIKEEICNAFGLNIGMLDKEANRSNSDTAMYAYMRDAIRPRLIRMQEKLNEKLMPRYDEKLFLAFDNPIPEDKEFRLKEMETHIRTAYSTVNMERAIDKEDKVPWGDKPLVSAQLLPLDKLGADKVSNTPPSDGDENVG